MVRNLLGELQNRNNPFDDNFGESSASSDTKNFDEPSGSPGKTNPFGDGTDAKGASPNPFDKVEMTQTSPSTINPFGGDEEDPAPSYQTPVINYNPFAFDTVDSEDSDDEDPLDFQKSYAEFQYINEKIENMENQIIKIRSNVQQYEKTFTPTAINDLNRTIKKQISETRHLSSTIAEEIKGLRTNIYDNTDEDDDTTLSQYKRNQFHLCIKKYEESLESLRFEVDHFRSVGEQKVKRIAETIDVDLPEETLEKLREDPQKAQKMIQEQLVSDEVLEKLAHLEDIRDAAQDIEQGLKELSQLWQEFNMLLALQQERVDSIADNVAKAHSRVISGTKILDEAESAQQCARKNQCYIMLCCMLLMFLVFGGVGISTLS